MNSYVNCKKCNKLIEKHEIINYGLCWNCYHDYLLQKIENAEKNKSNPPAQKTMTEKLLDFIKKIRKSRFFN